MRCKMQRRLRAARFDTGPVQDVGGQRAAAPKCNFAVIANDRTQNLASSHGRGGGARDGAKCGRPLSADPAERGASSPERPHQNLINVY